MDRRPGCPLIDVEGLSGRVGFVESAAGDRYLLTGTKRDGLFQERLTALEAGDFPPTPAEDLPEDLEPVDERSLDPLTARKLHIGLAEVLSKGDDGVPDLSGCRVDINAYQFRPLMTYLRNPDRRILIADEAGLGKTIEAGYILLEEMKRSDLDRVIIVAPSRLIGKWRSELHHRFGLFFDHLRGDELAEAIASPDRPVHGIVSIDAMRGPEDDIRAALEDGSTLDMMIIDEIHHLIGRSGKTLRRELGIGLSLASDRVVGLSATPVGIEEEDLLRVLQIIDPVAFPDDQGQRLVDIHSKLGSISRLATGGEGEHAWQLMEQLRREVRGLASQGTLADQLDQGLIPTIDSILDTDAGTVPAEKAGELLGSSPLNRWMTRTTRRQVGEDRERRIRTDKVELPERTEATVWVDGERRELSQEEVFEELNRVVDRWFSYSHKRQLSSSPIAMDGLIAAGAEGGTSWGFESSGTKGWGTQPEPIEGGLSKDGQEACERLLTMLRAIPLDGKLQHLQETLEEFRRSPETRKVVLFTQWLPTLDTLRDRSSQLTDAPTYFLSGDDPARVRRQTVSQFSEGDEFKVLIATDILSEGLDLVAADAVINYDLPLNPQKLEQRIGRIDRICQRSETVHVRNILLSGAEDERILEKLYERVDAFHQVVGPAADLLEEFETSGREPSDEELEAIENEIEQELDDAEEGLEIYDPRTAEAAEEAASRHQPIGALVLPDAFQAFAMLLCGSKARNPADGFEVPSLPPETIDELARLSSDIKDQRISDAIQAWAGSEEPIVFQTGTEGTFLPHQHPVARSICQVIELVLEGSPPAIEIHDEGATSRRLMGLEASVGSGEGRSHRHFFAQATPSGTEEMEARDVLSMFDSLSDGSCKELSPRPQWSELRETMEERCEAWMRTRAQQEANKEVRRLQHRWGRTKQLIEESDGQGHSELEGTLDEIGSELDEAKEAARDPMAHTSTETKVVLQVVVEGGSR